MSSPQEMANLVSRMYTIGQFCFFSSKRGESQNACSFDRSAGGGSSLLDSFTGLSSVCYTQPTRTLGISMDQAMLLPLMEAGRQ